jgi:CBS domain containing-hemolysin-like protein
VTVEDVLEELVGEIEDEFDITGESFLPGAPWMILDGSVNIRELESQYHIVLPRDDGFETLAGFVLARLQRIPKPGDSFEYEGRRYTVGGMDGLRVESVKIETTQPAPPQTSSSLPVAH